MSSTEMKRTFKRAVAARESRRQKDEGRSIKIQNTILCMKVGPDRRAGRLSGVSDRSAIGPYLFI